MENTYIRKAKSLQKSAFQPLEILFISANNQNEETSPELQMLSIVTIDCQMTNIVRDSGSQLSELLSVSQMSQVPVLSLSLSLLLLSIIVMIVITVKLFIIVNNKNKLNCLGHVSSSL